MKKIIVAVAASIPLLAFSADFISAGSKFRQDSEVIEGVEHGEINGIKYRIYQSDGSAAFQGIEGASLDGSSSYDGTNWSIGCRRDPMNDRVSCHINRGDFWVFAHQSGRVYVSVGNEHYPGSVASMRVDSLPPLQTAAGAEGDFDTKQSATIFSQMTKGQSYRTRYMKWPYRSWIDGEDSTRGFALALEYIKWAVRQASSGSNVSKTKR